MTDLMDLMIFARVAAEGNMSAAGRALDMSPAVVSKRLRKLEDQLGVRLLYRTTRQISLTEAGEGYLERVMNVLAAVEEADAFVAGRAGAAKGLLKIAAPTSFGRMHIAPHMAEFLLQNPDLTVDLVLSDEFNDIVGDGFDLAVRIGELADSSLVARRLAPVYRVLCAAPDYLKRNGTPKTVTDLADHVCLAAHQQDPWRLEGPDGPVTHRTGGTLRTNSSEVVREATLAGVGIALRSTWDIGPELADGRLAIVLPDYHGSDRVGLYAVYPNRQYLPFKVRLFIDFLCALYAEPYWDRGLSEFLPGG